MTALGTIVAASPLNANDGTRYTGFTTSPDVTETNSFALGDTPVDFSNMNTLSWTYDGRENINGGDDSEEVLVRIVNGGTILAAATAGGTFQRIYIKAAGGFSTTDVTRGPTAFSYVNTAANKATWDGASVEIRRINIKTKGPDGNRPEPDYFAVTGDYTAGATTVTGTAALTATGTLSGTGRQLAVGTAPLSATATFSGTAVLEQLAAADLAATASLSGTGLQQALAAAALTATALLEGTAGAAVTTVTGAAALAATATLQATDRYAIVIGDCSGGAASQATFSPAVGADDIHIYGSNVSDGASHFYVGRFDNSQLESSIRFPNVTIPQGALIISATLTLDRDQDGFGTTTGNVESAIYGISEDDFVQPVDDTEWNADPLTTAFTTWDFASSTTGQHTTPDFAAVIEEIVARSGWVSGNALGVRLVDTGATNEAQTWDSFNNGGTVDLAIEWTLGTVVQEDVFTGTNGDPWDSGKWTTSSPSGNGTQDIQSNEGRLLGTNGFAWDNRALGLGPDAADVEVSGTIEIPTVGYGYVWLRHSGTWESSPNQGEPTTGYGFNVQSGGTIQLLRANDGSASTVIGSDTGFTTATVHNFRFRMEGDAIKLKVWTGTEPAAWDIEVTDSTHAAAGAIAVSQFSISGGTAEARYDNIEATELVDGGGGPGGLAATATLTGTAGSAVTGAATLAATATLSGTGFQEAVAAAALSAAGTLSGTGFQEALGAAALSASGTLSGTGVLAQVGAAALAATGSLSGTGITLDFGVAALAASATFAGTGQTIAHGAATLAATATISGTAVPVRPAAADLTATASLQGTGQTVALAAADLTATATLSGTAQELGVVTGIAALTAAATFTGTAFQLALAAANLTATGSLQGTGIQEALAAANLTATGVLQGTPEGSVTGAATLSSSAAVTGTGLQIAIAAASLSATSTLTGTADDLTETITGAAALAATGTLSATGFQVAVGAATISATGNLTGSGSMFAVGAAAVTAAGLLAGAPLKLAYAVGQLAAAATLQGTYGLQQYLWHQDPTVGGPTGAPARKAPTPTPASSGWKQPARSRGQ